jgi:hypothetical protein
MAILLFVAGAVVLPGSKPTETRSLISDFERNGRWGLIFLCCYFIVSLWGNWVFWRVTPFDYLGAIVILLIVGIVSFLAIPNRRARAVISALYLALTVYAFLEFSPAAY